MFKILVTVAISFAFADSKGFQCSSNESLMALKALYLCGNEPEFGPCKSLAGYLAGRPLPDAEVKAAKALIQDAMEKKLASPHADSFSVIHAMVNHQLEADVEDYFPVEVLTGPTLAHAGSRLAAVKGGVWRYPPCMGKGEQYVNAAPAKNCEANPLGFNEATYKFLNASSEVHFKGLTNENVCDHYKQRMEHLVRRTVFVDLRCEEDSLTSVVRGSGANLERRIFFDKAGLIESVEFRLSNSGGHSVMDFKKGVPHIFTNFMEGEGEDAKRGKLTTRWEASQLSTGHPFYGELARLKFVVHELISCCREEDPALKIRCQKALSSPTPSKNGSARAG